MELNNLCHNILPLAEPSNVSYRCVGFRRQGRPTKSAASDTIRTVSYIARAGKQMKSETTEIVTSLDSSASFREQPTNSTRLCVSKTHSCKRRALVSLYSRKRGQHRTVISETFFGPI